MKVVLTSLLFLGTFLGFSQAVDSLAVEETKTVMRKHGVGVSVGDLTGVGVTYRYRPSEFGVQATVGAYKGGYAKNASLGFLYTLIQTDKTNLYAYQGTSYFVTEASNDDQRSEDFNIGAGFGIEIIIAKRLALSFINGYAYTKYDNGKRVNLKGALGLLYTL